MTLRMAGENRWNDPDSHITLAARLQKAIPNSYVLDQYKHRGNPLAHFESTGEEIVTAERFFFQVSSTSTLDFYSAMVPGFNHWSYTSCGQVGYCANLCCSSSGESGSDQRPRTDATRTHRVSIA